MPHHQTFFRGCLLGGAVGDALGEPVEFMSLRQIRAHHGPAGITEPSARDGELAKITDDTQMTLFTAEGLLRASSRLADRGICHTPTVVWHAYLRWLRTQDYHPRTDPPGNDRLVEGGHT